MIKLLIFKIIITGNFYPIQLKSDPLRKILGFEMLSNEIKKISDEKKISKIVFFNRGEITRFNYYLNRFDNKFKNKILLNFGSLLQQFWKFA